jgi:hypothetical protein
MSEMDSPALKYRDPEDYPECFNDRVPKKVKMLQTVKSDLPFDLGGDLFARVDQEYLVSVNSYGAVTALFPDGQKLGLKPHEFEVVEYHEQDNRKENHDKER